MDEKSAQTRGEISVLVCGLGETASAIARRLFAEDCAVAIHQSAPPRTLRRRMAFADAWFDGVAALDGVEARRADVNCEFLLGLRSRQFIPVLTQPFAEVTGRWPWDVIVWARAQEEPFETIANLADLTVALGSRHIAGVNCDIVVETEGRDPGAILRSGSAPARPRRSADDERDENSVRASASGVFSTTKFIGAMVETGEALGEIGGSAVFAPIAGRVRGLLRKGQAVAKGSVLADIATAPGAQVAGVSRQNQLVSRGVAFAVEMEAGGWEPASFEARG